MQSDRNPMAWGAMTRFAIFVANTMMPITCPRMAAGVRFCAMEMEGPI